MKDQMIAESIGKFVINSEPFENLAEQVLTRINSANFDHKDNNRMENTASALVEHSQSLQQTDPEWELIANTMDKQNDDSSWFFIKSSDKSEYMSSHQYIKIGAAVYSMFINEQENIENKDSLCALLLEHVKTIKIHTGRNKNAHKRTILTTRKRYLEVMVDALEKSIKSTCQS